MTYTKDNLRQIFQQPFNQEEWQKMLRHYFHATKLKAEPERINNTADDEQGYYLGALETTDNYRIGLFYYQIQRGNVARKRVGLRNLVKSFINPDWGEFDAALVVFDSGSVWRLSFVCDIKGENTAAKRFTYVFGENDNYYNTPVGRFDSLQRKGISFENIKDAFSVERLNKDFFNGYKERYVKFLKYINDDTKENRDYVKKLLGRIVFLQFLQKKGWMGVPANQQGWNGGDKFYLNHLIEHYEGNDRLLSDVLEPLFFNTLNERRDKDLVDSRLGENIKIPYLNGGLFDKDELDMKDIDFPYDYFKELMDFFAMYNFTIDENDPEDSEIGIDPEMLGHIFENLLEDNKDKGAFYTPKEIVQYMSEESIAQYLKTHTYATQHIAIDELIKGKKVNESIQGKATSTAIYKLLSEVKVCDPAIGSGAFPMGVLNVLYHARLLLYGFTKPTQDFSPAEVKRDIIQNNIYGVDIEKGAVDIARLRFWLALVVDENEPQPLPNLDYKIMCGDSLLHRFALDAPFQNILRDYNQKNHTNYTLEDYRQWVYDYTDISDHTQKDDFRQRIEDIKRAVKTELSDKEKGKIAKVRGAIDNLQMEDMFGGKKNEKKIKALQKELKALEQQRAEIESNKIYDQAFEWRFEFPALLDENGDFMGFDIVIGNPPYIDSETMMMSMPVTRDLYKDKFETAKGNWDIYVVFFELGMNLLNHHGVLSYITPNKWISIGYGKAMRDSYYGNLFALCDCQKIKVFEAGNEPVISIFLKGNCGKINVSRFEGNYTSHLIQSIPKTKISKDNLGMCISDKLPILANITRQPKTIGDYIDVENPFSTSEAYELIEILKDEYVEGEYKLINTGTIDPYINLWGSKTTSYLKGKYTYPTIDKKKFQSFFPKRVRQVSSPKIVITGMRYFECFYDATGDYVAGKSTIILLNPRETHYFKVLLGILNSKLITFFIRESYSTLGIGGGINFSRDMVEGLPMPIFSDKSNKIISLVDIILKSKTNSVTSDTSVWESEIDLLVYHLYGLTYDEVLIVDPETPITREEYEDKNNL